MIAYEDCPTPSEVKTLTVCDCIRLPSQSLDHSPRRTASRCDFWHGRLKLVANHRNSGYRCELRACTQCKSSAGIWGK